MERIEADLLIPGSGEPVKNGAVVIDGSRIAFAGCCEVNQSMHSRKNAASRKVRCVYIYPARSRGRQRL